MEYTNYLTLVSEAAQATSAESFIAEYGYPADCPYTAEGLEQMCNIIFAVSRRDFAQLVDIAGLSGRAFGLKYNIPPKSVQQWAAGDRKAPDYVVELIGFVMLSELPREEE